VQPLYEEKANDKEAERRQRLGHAPRVRAGQVLYCPALSPMRGGRRASLPLPSIQLLEAAAKRPRVLDRSDIGIVGIGIDATTDDVTAYVIAIVRVISLLNILTVLIVIVIVTVVGQQG
jgi:hypothetical protein